MQKLPEIKAATISELRSTNSETSERQAWAAKMAARLFDYFGPPETGDPRVMLSGAVQIFMSYPREAVEAVCDPVRGLPGELKWAPRLAEIRHALEVAMGPIRRREELEGRERQAKAQIAERQRMLPSPDKPRKTYEQLQAELAEVGIFIGNRGATAKPVNVKEFREKYGISQEQWDAIPNAS
jgi:hypothetical protein